MTAVAQLIPESTVSLVGTKTGAHLIGETADSRFECRQRGPVAAVQRQLPNSCGIHRCTNGGRGGLNIRRRGVYLDGLIELADFQAQIQCLLRADRETDFLLDQRLKSLACHADFIGSRKDRKSTRLNSSHT